MSTQSNVGDRRVYEDGDQKKYSKDELQEEEFSHGKANSHNPLDSKDERSIANKLARESKRDDEPEEEKDRETELLKKDPTLPALAHGNKPSKGAQIDKEIADEEAEILKKKGAGFGGPKGT